MNPRYPVPVPLVLSGILLLALAVIPVYGEGVELPTITHVYFEQNGTPYNGSVEYTVTCYGHIARGSASLLSGNSTAPRTGIVFSYSATCAGYGCLNYEPFSLSTRQIYRCDLSGVADNRSFTLSNYSATPLPPDCTTLLQFEMDGNDGNYYNTTPEYKKCIRETSREADRCDQFMASCDPTTRTDCNRTMNGRAARETPESQSCRSAAEKNQTSCSACLKKVDPSTIIVLEDNGSEVRMPLVRICEQHFSIPAPGSGNSTLQNNHTTSGSGLVGSLYCSILSLFNAGC